MAELSEQTQAIIDRMKAEGDLVRNSGTNSIRQVNVKLDKFQGLFETISSNVIQQTSILSKSANLQVEQLEAERTREQFQEIDPPEASPTTDSSDQLEQSKKTNETIEKIGDSISGALNLKNIALAGLGGFLTYNLLKGFIEQGLQDNLLGMNDLKTNLSGLSGFNPKESFDNLQASVDNLTTTITDIKEQIESIDLGDIISTVASAFLGISTVLTGIRIWAYRKQVSSEKRMNRAMADFEERLRNNRPLPETEQGRSGAQDPRKLGDTPEARRAAADAERLRNQQGRSGAGDPRNFGDTPEARRAAGQPRLYDDAILRQQRADNFQTRSIRPAQDGRRDNGQFASKDEIEQAFKDERMRRIFQKILKGLGAIGIIITAVEMVQLYEILNSDASDEEKIQALGSVIGSFVGAASGLTAGASVGSFFGPWGALILGAIGAGLGAWAGGYIGELIAKWAFDESVSSNDRAKNAEMINSTNATDYGYESMSQQGIVNAYGVGGTAYGVNNTPDYMKYLDPNYNAQNAPTPVTPLRYGGRGNIVEQNGERAAYNREQQMVMLDAVMQQQQQQNNTMADLMSYLGIEPSTNGVRSAQIQAASEAGAGGTPIVINNTPIVAPQTINQSNGGSSVKVTNATFGGGGGGGANPYNLPSGIN